MRLLRAISRVMHVLIGGLLVIAPLDAALALDILHVFAGSPNDGVNPESGVVEDKSGDLYGTTTKGGTDHLCGIVFKLAPDGTETVVHSFSGSDGCAPSSGVIVDKNGDLYGETSAGGTGGTVYKVEPDGSESVLHYFAGGTDGAYPMGGVVEDNAGNLYGTTYLGGAKDFGVVFKVAPDGTETILHSFGEKGDGAGPFAGLVTDGAGNLYGTTFYGGRNECAEGCGTVFELKTDGSNEKVLYRFRTTTNDGSYPQAPLILDESGNLYGTTPEGGHAGGGGTVFKVTPNGTETLLYSFAGGADGAVPRAGLVADAAGDLFGTTPYGGNNRCEDKSGCGTVFEVAADGTETVLHRFVNNGAGHYPVSTLIFDGKGNLVGTTSRGKHCKAHQDCGTVFALHP